MYKILFLLKKNNDPKVLEHFNNYILKYLSEISGSSVKSALVESNLLLEQKYESYCELIAPSKEDMDKMMNTDAGRELNKDLADFHKHIDLITVNYNR
jgi:predicted nucleotide-binding protein (sugar kinase/HSP70/actin superfamily)